MPGCFDRGGRRQDPGEIENQSSGWHDVHVRARSIRFILDCGLDKSIGVDFGEFARIERQMIMYLLNNITNLVVTTAHKRNFNPNWKPLSY